MSFKENGYYIIRDFLDPDFVKFIQQYFFTRINAGQATLGDELAPNSYCFYGDPLMDTILGEAAEELSKVADYPLLPTYTYTRLYGKGDELIIHRDRPSCELSATLALGVPEGEEVSSIYFAKDTTQSDVCHWPADLPKPENATAIYLNPGDLCLYHGCDLWHWREPFTQKWYLQSFLHYVNAEGPYRDFLYDKRPYLGMQK
jgi:hypothetical protein